MISKCQQYGYRSQKVERSWKRNCQYAENNADEVKKTIEEFSELIGSLKRESAEISKITSTIKGISSQTNLLALNATIEAARAEKREKALV